MFISFNSFEIIESSFFFHFRISFLPPLVQKLWPIGLLVVNASPITEHRSRLTDLGNLGFNYFVDKEILTGYTQPILASKIF